MGPDISVSAGVYQRAREQLTIPGGSRATLVRREGAGPQRAYTRPGTGSLHPVAIRAVVEATKLLKPLVQRVAKATRPFPRQHRRASCASLRVTHKSNKENIQ
jgi:hypothetical protein